MREDKKNTIHIDSTEHHVESGALTGAEIKALGGIASTYDLWLVVPGPGGDRRVADSDTVELKSGAHFVSAPTDINPGRQMLPSADEAYLREKGFEYEIHTEGPVLLIIKNYPMPEGFAPPTTDLLIELPNGYPATKLDMYYVDPHVSLISGATLRAAEARVNWVGRSWQRFSRHLAGDAWRPGIDGLASYLPLLRADLEESAA